MYVLSRIAVFPMLPWLSDDVFGYLFYGHELASDVNPYIASANAPALEYLRNDAYNLMAFKQYPAIYPPVSVYFMAVSDVFARFISNDWKASFYCWKLVLFIHEFLAIVVLLYSRVRQHISLRYLAGYILMPLPAVEIMGQGHNEGLVLVWIVFFLVGLFAILRDKITSKAVAFQTFLLGAVAGVLGMIKIIPGIIGLALLIVRRKSIGFSTILLTITGIILSAALLGLPLLHSTSSITNFLSILNIYNNTYFNSPPLMFLRSAGEIFAIPEWWLVAPKILTLLRFSAILLLLFVLRPDSFRSAVICISYIYAAAVIISPKVHVWYFVPLLLLSVITRQRWLVVFSYATVASYFMYSFREQHELLGMEYCIWIGTAVFALYDIGRAHRISPVLLD